MSVSKAMTSSFKFAVIFAGILDIYSLQNTQVFLNLTTENSPYKMCLSGFKSLSVWVMECQNAYMTMFHDIIYNSHIIEIRPSKFRGNDTEILIGEMFFIRIYYYVYLEKLPDICTTLAHLDINWEERNLTVRLDFIDMNITREWIIPNHDKDISYLTVSSESSLEPGKWNFDIPQSELDPMRIDPVLQLPGKLCPLNPCNYSTVLSSQNCGFAYKMIAPQCDNGDVYLPFKWCKEFDLGFKSCRKALTVMGCLSSHDSCQSCYVTNFRGEIRKVCKQTPSGQQIKIANIDSCENFTALWSAYFSVGYDEGATDELYFSTTSENDRSMSTPDGNVISEDVTTRADTTTVATSVVSGSGTTSVSFVTTDITTISTEETTDTESPENGKTSDKKSIIGIVGVTFGGSLLSMLLL